MPLSIISMVSCNKDYVAGGGLSKATTSLGTYDYLASNQYHIFDSVLLVIDHFGLKDSLNSSGSFFAPTDYCLNRYLINNQFHSLDSLYNHISSKFITQFMFPDTSLTLANTTTNVTLYPNWADTLAGVKKTGFNYGAASSTFSYYILQYVQINGALDGLPSTPTGDPTDAVLNCQTTGIKTSSGTNLNVLANTSDLLGR